MSLNLRICSPRRCPKTARTKGATRDETRWRGCFSRFRQPGPILGAPPPERRLPSCGEPPAARGLPSRSEPALAVRTESAANFLVATPAENNTFGRKGTSLPPRAPFPIEFLSISSDFQKSLLERLASFPEPPPSAKSVPDNMNRPRSPQTLASIRPIITVFQTTDIA